jgi:hypothetical protein
MRDAAFPLTTRANRAPAPSVALNQLPSGVPQRRTSEPATTASSPSEMGGYDTYAETTGRSVARLPRFLSVKTPRTPVSLSVECAPVKPWPSTRMPLANVALRCSLPAAHSTPSSLGRAYCIGPRRRVSIMGVYARHGVRGRIVARVILAVRRQATCAVPSAEPGWPGHSRPGHPDSYSRSAGQDSFVQFLRS